MEDLSLGRKTSRQLVEDCLANIEAPDGEGARAFISVDDQGARAAADACDSLRAANVPVGRYAGIPVSIKDLYDIEGQVTRAGSRALDDAPAATQDAVAVARLRNAGFILIGRTNMTEFAYSGLGLNPQYGTPLCAWDRAAGRIPGGSSSGAAISVSDGMAHAALGTDTGGSCRIPAAFNGLTGFKPTAHRVPQSGAVPLSTSLDSIGPIARSVECCAALDAVIAAQPRSQEAADIRGLRLLVPGTVAIEGLQDKVSEDFRAALGRLSEAGARIFEMPFPEFAEVAGLQAKGGLTAAESHAYHRRLVEEKAALYDPRVVKRILRGAEQSAADYIGLVQARKSLIARASLRLAGFDALLMPTVPVVPPLMRDVESEDAFTATNLLVLRNSTLINMIDGCAISLPIHEAGSAPVGLTVASHGGNDARLLAVAAAIERVASSANAKAGRHR